MKNDNIDKIKVGASRKIEFDEKLRESRNLYKQGGSSDYDISRYELIDHEFKDGGRKRVYKNLNFSVFVDDYCNADCKFCVAQLRYHHKNELYKKGHITDPDKYLARLDEVLKIVRPLDPSVSLTGGEPTLSPLLTEVLKLVDKYGFRKRTITTNGSGLLRVQDNDIILNNLIRYKWDHLNISRVSPDDSINRAIMRFSEGSEYCDMAMLREILEICSRSSLKHRLSCLLLKECVHDVAGIKNYADILSEAGADNFIFRELMDYDRLAVNTEKTEYCRQNKIKLYDIWHQFRDHPEFVPYLNLLGYYYYVEIYKYRNMTIASETADMNIQNLEKAAHPDIVYEMIFHTSGHLTGSWVEKEEILDRYEP
ncbi:MAG: radical SAM protein [Ruminococcus sp.]|nr:radical SAM protein [Ruminococcus sp.]